MMKKKEKRDHLRRNQLKILASDIRAKIFSVCSQNGGHLSSNLGTVELTISLLQHFDAFKDDILFDVGHQAYAYKILTGRDITSIRKDGGIAPFNLRSESEADTYNNGHAGDCLGTAMGIAKAKMLSHDETYTIAIIGDGSIGNGLSYEALDLLSKDSNYKRLIVIINDNEMSISKNNGPVSKRVSRFRNSRFYFRSSSRLGNSMSKHKWSYRLFCFMKSIKDHFKRFFISSTLFEAMNIKYIGPYDGHDFEDLDLAFEKAKIVSNKGACVLHLLTQKGQGYVPAEKDEQGIYHGVNKHFEENFDTSIDYSQFKSTYLMEMMEKDEKIFVISPAMEQNSKLHDLFVKYPERSIDTGIAEENAVLYASGLALKGYRPMVDIYSTFMQRCYDEIIENVSRQDIRVVFIVERAGLVGEDGSSHQGIYDVAMVKSIPYRRVFMPFDSSSIIELPNFTKDIEKGPIFIRLPKGEIYAADFDGVLSKLGYFYAQNEDKKTIVIAIGPLGYGLLRQVSDSVTKLQLVDLLPPFSLLDEYEISSYENIILYDPYSTQEGTSSYFSDYLLKKGFKGKYTFFAFENDFVTHGSVKHLLKTLSMDIDSVLEKIQQILPKE